MKLRNSAIEGYEAELQKCEEMNSLIEKHKVKCEPRYITRFIADKVDHKVCICEYGYLDDKEKGFVIAELTRICKTRVFCVEEKVWEIDGLE